MRRAVSWISLLTHLMPCAAVMAQDPPVQKETRPATSEEQPASQKSSQEKSPQPTPKQPVDQQANPVPFVKGELSNFVGSTKLIKELDQACRGGLPRGRIIEATVLSRGAGTLLYGLLAAGSSRGDLCALVDPADGFEITSAQGSGVELERLLWVRSRNKKEALQAMELILHGSEFGTIVLDLTLVREPATKLPASAWMRIKRLAPRAGAVVAVLSRTSEVGPFASLSVRVQPRRDLFVGGSAQKRCPGGNDLCFQLYRQKL